MIDIYDHEVDALIRVQYLLTQRAQEKRHNYADFEREIKERFAEVGFVVAVNWHRFGIGGQVQEGAMPEVTVVGRTDPAAVFDPDRQVHEVTSNLLEIPGEDGVIKTDRDTVRDFLSGNDHGHGHAH
jgi:hypothetical protein